MAKARRIIRKVKPLALKAFDEQLWPVNIALLVFAGFVAGVILVVFRGNEGNIALWRWTSLTVLGGTVAIAMLALRYLDNRKLKRGVQFSFVLSLILHLVMLVIFAIWRPLWMDTGEEQPVTEEQQQREQVTIPEYHVAQVTPTESPREDFQRPVETETPDPQPEEVEQQQIEHQEERQPQIEPSPVPEPEVSVQPNPVERQTPSETQPRESRQSSQLSRSQRSNSQPMQASQVWVPTIKNQPSQTQQTVQAQASQVQRQQTTQPQVSQRRVEAEPTTTSQQQAVQIARRTSEQTPTPQTTSAPTMQRAVARPQQVPRSTVATAAQPTVPRRTQPTELQPSNVAPQRTATTSPEVARRAVTEPTPTVSQQVTQQVARRQQPSPERPTMAQTPTSVPNQRRPAEQQPSATAVAAAPSVTQSPTQSQSPSLQPSASSVSRQSTQTPVANRTPQPTEVAAASPTAQVSRVQPRRTVSMEAPSVDATAPATPTPRQAARAAAVAASPSPVASPAVAESPRASQPSFEPSRTALSRSTSGTAGIGAAPNLDRSLPSPSRPSQVASASARRAEATQTMAEGPAMSPSEPASVARARAGAEAPSATMMAQNVEVANAPGSQQPAELQASSSAAIQRSASNATQSSVTAARGTVEVDIGPQRTVSNNAAGRAAGGGQPTINFEAQTSNLARANAGGAPSAAIAATRVSDVPEAPAAEGGGQPPSSEATPDASAVVRTQASGDLPVSGGPSSADEAGDPTPAGSATQVASAQFGRATTVEATPGAPETGGGTSSPLRSASGPPLPTSITSTVVEISGQPDSSGEPDGTPIEAEGTAQTRLAAGAANPATGDVVGALAGDVVVDSPAGEQTGPAVGQRQSSPSELDGPVVADASVTGAPFRRSNAPGLPTGAVAQIDIPDVGQPSEEGEPGPQVDQLAGDMSDMGSVSRQETGSLPVETAALEGPGGLANEVTPDVGTISRRASRDSTEVHVRPVRFIQKQSGGLPSVNAVATITLPGFQERINRKEGRRLGGGFGEPSQKTEEAVELGLVFLSNHQSPDGSWSLHNYAVGKPYQDRVDTTAAIHADSAATGLCLLAFLGAGYHHQDDKYQDVVRAGLDYLLKYQKDNGDLYVPEDDNSNRSAAFYSHGICTIALCEAYGMTQDPEVRDAAQKAVDYIVDTQHKVRGGWRYSPGNSSDTSVTGWMMMALKSAELSNLEVPSTTFEGIEKWLARAQSQSQPHLYVYNPDAPAEQAHGKKTNNTMTAVGLLMRLYGGWRRDNDNLVKGAKAILENLPAMGSQRNPKRDTYYWYYATQVMFHMKGEYWDKWWDQSLYPLLIGTQVQEGPLAGSWNPRYPVPDRWGPHAGRIYVTTMNLLSLEVFYRHLPIYEDTAR